MSFIGRTRELKTLEDLYRKPGAHMLPVYGRRRVGKTALLERFVRDKPHVFVVGTLATDAENLAQFSRKLGETLGDETLVANPLTSWELLFRTLAARAGDRKLVVVVDEFPYLLRHRPELPSLLQAAWDQTLSKTRILLILCGSHVGMMEREVLAHSSPLFGRRAGQMELKPLPFPALKELFPRKSLADRVELHAILGGMPGYLKEFDPDRPLDENLAEAVFQPDRMLCREVEFLLREELREPSNYMAVLKAIGTGRTRLNDISQHALLDAHRLAPYLATLMELGLVDRKLPVTEPHPHKSRRGLYVISDPFVRFWFAHVYPHRDLIERNRGKQVVDRHVVPALPGFVSYGFESLCREAARSLDYDRVGSWWDRFEEIDVAALHEERREILLGECRWSRKPMGYEVFEQLLAKKERIEWEKDRRRERFALFSKSGFTRPLKDEAEKGTLELFDLPAIERLLES